MTKLAIEIETADEEGLHTLLKHVCNEIVDKNYRNYEIELNSRPKENWLVVDKKGRYRWSKN